MKKILSSKKITNHHLFHHIKMSPFPTLLINTDTSIKLVNNEFTKLTGYSSKELIGKRVPYPWWLPKKLNKTIENYYQSLKTGEQKECFQTKDGNQFFVKIKVIPISSNGKIEYYFSDWWNITTKQESQEIEKRYSDKLDLSYKAYNELMAENIKLENQISKRKEIEAHLNKSLEKIKIISSHLQKQSEDQRFSIAREIHDELGQSLTILKLESSWLLEHALDEPEHFIENLQRMTEMIDSAIKQVQSLSNRLRPSILDDLGIIPAIEWQVKNFRDITGISCDFEESINIKMNKEFDTALYRVFQEALTNITRHACATAVKVSLKNRDKHIILKIRDNGVGITEEQIYDRKSLGILGIFERIHDLHGEVKINGIKGQGTTIVVSLPINNEDMIID